jgi:hypothetical protein
LNHKRLSARYRNTVVRELYRRVGGGSRPFVNPVFAQLKAVLFGGFLAVKDRPFDAFDLYNRTEATWAQIIPCEYQSNPVAKVRFAVVIRKSLYCSIPHCLRLELKST